MASACLFGLILLASGLAADGVKKNYDVPADDAARALKQFAAQSGEQLLYSPDEVAGARTLAVRGEFTAREALEKMTEGTTLVVSQDPATGALAVRQETAAEAKNGASRPADAATANLAGSRGARIESGAVQLDRYEVTGSRIRRDPLETNIDPVTVYNRVDIERSGAANISDFVGRITQATASADRFETGNFPMSGRTTVNLRGLGNNTTLVLVNGRRIAKSGQGFNFDDYNLNAFPLGAVERIEILTDGASAIYGSDAIGGVVNIILRDDFNGAEMHAQYGNTFDTDVAERTINFSYGNSGTFGRGRKYSAVINGSYSDRSSLLGLDRPYTARANYPGGAPLPAVGFATPASGAGSVSRVPAVPIFDPPPLPNGLVRVAIPAGQDGRGLTSATLLAQGAPLPSTVDVPAYNALVSPTRSYATSASFKVDWSPQLQFFADGSYSNYRAEYIGLPPTVNATVPATNPFNPMGFPVQVTKLLYELGPSGGFNENRISRAVAGVRGDVFGTWRYELSGSFDRSIVDVRATMQTNFAVNNQTRPDGTVFVPPARTALDSTNPATALNLFGDGRTTQPNDPAFLRSMLGIDEYRETATMWNYGFKADGALFTLPAGDLKVAIGGEYREEDVKFSKLNSTGGFFPSLDNGVQRDVTAAFAEVAVPVFSSRQNIPALDTLLVTLAGRIDAESLFGNEEFTPKYGVLWKPVPSFAVRANLGHGYKIPTLQQLTNPVTTRPTTFSPPILDPVTGTTFSGPVNATRGGNINLLPENSVSRSIGVIFEPRPIRGLAITVDYFDIDYTDKVLSNFSTQQLLTLFPHRATRNPTTNAITLLDFRPINLSRTEAKGVDAKITYRFTTATLGQFDVRVNYTYNIDSLQQTLPGAAFTENVDTPFLPRVRANADIFWRRRAWEVGMTSAYESSTSNTLATGATYPRRIERALEFDAQVSYDFDEGRIDRSARRWAGGLKLTVGILNLLDREPPHTDGDGGYAKTDPRQRRYYLALRKRL